MVFQFAAVSDIHILRGLEFHLGTLKGCQLPMVPLCRIQTVWAKASRWMMIMKLTLGLC